jgi:DNA-binding CsgD family transcriptional regulator
MPTDDPAFAYDVAVAWLFTGNLEEGAFWCHRGEQLASPRDRVMQLRRCTVRGMLAMLGGDIEGAEHHVAEYERLAYAGRLGPLEDRFATTAARVMLVAGRLDDAAVWVDRGLRITEPAVIAQVNAPALAAWQAFERGRLLRARELADAAHARAEALGMRPHHGSSEALVVAAWCRVASGDLAGARQLSDAATTDSEILGVPWNRVRSGVLAAELRRLAGSPRAALLVLHDLRADLGASCSPGTYLADHILAAQAAALIDDGNVPAALELIEQLADGPRRRLLSARTTPGDRSAIESVLGDRSGWPRQWSLAADVMLAAACPEDEARRRLSAALTDGDASGWVSPFLGHGAHVDALLRQLGVHELHPALAKVIAAPTSSADDTGATGLDRLTPRELRLLHFLPTHLSYAEIGERLFISVNTVKTNLKALYRKLGATTRAEAVEMATRAGLMPPGPLLPPE